jgi:hypothetical protein
MHPTHKITLNQFNVPIIDTDQKKEKIMCDSVHENDQKSIKIE